MTKLPKLSIAAVKSMMQPTRRDLNFKLDPEIIGEWHWAAGPIFTNFLNTFSTVLPIGERFFIRSVRHYRSQITDPELKKAVTAFIGQEAMHGREHETYNDAFFSRVPVGAKFEKLVQRILEGASEHLPASLCLSATIALEHFTALLGEAVLSDERVSAGADPHYAAILRWHALEEVEHKAVAYDVWEAVMGNDWKAYGIRSFGLVAATVIFWGLVIPTFLQLLRTEGQLTNVDGWRKFLRYTVGDIGMLRRQLGNYFSYFKPGFHPWDHDNRHHLEQLDNFLAYHEKLSA